MSHSSEYCSFCSRKTFKGKFNCINCPYMNELNEVFDATIIQIKNCNNLYSIKLNEEYKIDKMECKKCKLLNSFWFADSVNDLICNDCPNLMEIRSGDANNEHKSPRLTRLVILNNINLNVNIQFRGLEYLDCTGSTQISLAKMENLRTLICSYTDIKEIPLCHNLKSLTCNYCQMLKFIPDLFELQYLDVIGCKNIRRITNLISLKILECSHTNIERIFLCNNLEQIICDNCQTLTEIEELPKLIDIIIYKCEYITRIKNLGSIRHINCSHCYRLSQIDNIQSLRSITFYYCPNLDILNSIKTIYNKTSQRYINPYMNAELISEIKLFTSLPYIKLSRSIIPESYLNFLKENPLEKNNVLITII